MIDKCERCITGCMVKNYGDIYCINCGWRKPSKPSANHLFTINYKYNASVLNLESIVDRAKAKKYLSRCVGSQRKGTQVNKTMATCPVCDGDIPIDFDGNIVNHKPTQWFTQKLKRALKEAR
tara:strand:- start:133 stop:498 length:366 start_codon:yes stop_codon:yes gene_type:complete